MVKAQQARAARILIDKSSNAPLKSALLEHVVGLPAEYTVDEIAVNRKVEKECVLYQVVETESKIIVGQCTQGQGGDRAEDVAHAMASLRCAGYSKEQLTVAKKGLLASFE